MAKTLVRVTDTPVRLDSLMFLSCQMSWSILFTHTDKVHDIIGSKTCLRNLQNTEDHSIGNCVNHYLKCL